MAGWLMSAVLWGPQRPLQPSLTEEQFICQHPPALLRYLIPPFARGHGLPWRTLTATSLPDPSRRWQSMALGWLRDKCLHWMTAITSWKEWTGMRPDRQYHYDGVKVFVLTVILCDVIVRGERRKKAEKKASVFMNEHVHTHAHNTINCTTRARNSNYRGFSINKHSKCTSVFRL